MNRVPVTVVIRTVDRPVLLKAALASLKACEPSPAEILVIDQSHDLSSQAVLDAVGPPKARAIRGRGRGRGRALNEGLRHAGQRTVLFTDDDCTVRPDWVGVAAREMEEDPDGIITGQVLAIGDDPRAVPSTIALAEPRDFTGEIHHGVLFAGNMACPRDAAIALGGFDERIGPVSEDCDFCYRWLRAGRRLRYVPELVVYHHDWRSRDALSRHYVGYYHAQGMFYAKHLLAGDLTMLRFLALDYVAALRSLYSGLVRGVPRWADARRGTFRGMPRGLWAGWKEFSRDTRWRRVLARRARRV